MDTAWILRSLLLYREGHVPVIPGHQDVQLNVVSAQSDLLSFRPQILTQDRTNRIRGQGLNNCQFKLQQYNRCLYILLRHSRWHRLGN
jgi:hypothetical protein